MSESNDQSNGPALDRFIRTEIAILVFVIVLVMLPFTPDGANDIKILLYSLGAAALAFVCIGGRLLSRQPLHRPQLLLAPLVVFLGLLLVSALLSKHPGNSLAELSKFGALFVLYLLAGQVYRTPEQIQRLMLVVCSAVGISIVYATAQHFGHDPFPWNPEQLDALKEAPGTFGNGNLAAHTTVLCIVMAVYLAVARRNVAYLLFVGLFVLHLNLSNQRGGALGLCAALALVASAWVLGKWFKRPATAVIAAFLVTGLIGAGGIVGLSALLNTTRGVPYPGSLPFLLRYHGFWGATHMIEDKPVLGYGIENYRLENPAYWSSFEQEHFAIEHKMNFHVHNDVLEFGVDGGLAAAGLYLTILVAAIGCALYMGISARDPGRRKAGFAFAALFCTFMVDGFFGFNMRVPVSALVFFLMAGVFERLWASGRPEKAPTMPRKATLAAGLLLCVLATAVAAIQVSVFASQVQLQRGRGAMYWKAFPEADAFLAKGERFAPWNADFAYQRGEAALQAKDSAAAFSHFERAHALNPHHLWILIGMARAKIMEAEVTSVGQPAPQRLAVLEDAVSYAERTLELCPVLPEGEDMLGRAASLRAMILAASASEQSSPSPEALEAWGEAALHLREAIRLRGADDVGRLYLMLALARSALNDTVGAQQAFARSARNAPDSRAVWPMFYRFAASQGSEDTFRQTVWGALAKADSGEGQGLPELRAVAMVWERGAEALQEACTLLAQAARDPQVDGNDRKNMAWPVTILYKAIEDSDLSASSKAACFYPLGFVCAGAEQWERVDVLFGRAWPDLPTQQRTECLIGWAQSLRDRDKAEVAIQILREALKKDSLNAHLQLALARLLREAGRTAEAKAEYDVLIRLFNLDAKAKEMVKQEMDSLTAQPGGV